MVGRRGGDSANITFTYVRIVRLSIDYRRSNAFCFVFFKNSTKDRLWKIYDEATGELLPSFVDKYKPQEGSTTILKFITSMESESSASETLAGMGLIVLCISAIVEGLLFL